jgi:hypothetical protein
VTAVGTRPLVRCETSDGLPIYLHPSRVTQVAPATDRIDSNGATPRSLVYVMNPHILAPRREGVQGWDTDTLVVRGTPDEIVAVLWPQQAARP